MGFHTRYPCRGMGPYTLFQIGQIFPARPIPGGSAERLVAHGRRDAAPLRRQIPRPGRRHPSVVAGPTPRPGATPRTRTAGSSDLASPRRPDALPGTHAIMHTTIDVRDLPPPS